MNLQYLSDTQGRHTAVVIPIDDWNNLAQTYKGLKDLESPYDPEFVAKVRKSEQEFEEGNYISLKREDIKQFLGL